MTADGYLNAATVRAWLRLAATAIQEQRDYLTQLDAAIGDADHGSNMSRGFTALRTWLDTRDNDVAPGPLLVEAGVTLAAAIGGASGALWGTALRGAGAALGDDPEFDGMQLAAALDGALDAVVQLGAAAAGDKTMVDALAPAASVLRKQIVSGAGLAAALRATREAGENGMKATALMQARKGRASYLGERSIGHQDPGATSTSLIIGALEEAVNSGRE